MKVEITIPSPGESISEVEIARWLVEDSTWVEKDQELAEIESEKATLPLLASHSGLISILKKQGSIKVGEVACTIDTDASKPHTSKPIANTEKATKPIKETSTSKQMKEEKTAQSVTPSVKVTPIARKLMEEKGLSVDEVVSGIRRITSKEVNSLVNASKSNDYTSPSFSRNKTRTPMSQLRKKLSERLVAVKNETAMLTTFNEVDMSKVIAIRSSFQKEFTEKHGVKLGFMSFFTKAVVGALIQHPMVNSQIVDEEIVTPNYYDIGIAVQTPKGLMVPVLRNAETLTMAQIEQQIAILAEKGRSGRINLDDLSGGTFTITNGGVFGSMLSTPILNPPQSGILGMHSITERPVAINGKVEIRPMMYIALSYDHRIIDGKDSVGFLLKVKESIENPERLFTNGHSLERILLGLV